MADQVQEIVARLRLLATTAGPENVTQALRMIAATAAERRTLDRYAASLLASCHPLEALAVAFTGGSSSGGDSEELRACLVHEPVLRGVVVAGSREVGDVAALEASPAGLAAPDTVRLRGRPASAQLRPARLESSDAVRVGRP